MAGTLRFIEGAEFSKLPSRSSLLGWALPR
jgi:hypothetical protein